VLGFRSYSSSTALTRSSISVRFIRTLETRCAFGQPGTRAPTTPRPYEENGTKAGLRPSVSCPVTIRRKG
jgi:hypothetical protein